MIDMAQTYRRPRCRLLASGTEIEGCHSVEISVGNMGQAGAFFAQIANAGNQIGSGSRWYDEATIDVRIQLGFLMPGMPEGQLSWQDMMAGRVDRVRLDPVGGLVTIEGRDYAARLLDLPVTECFLNCTSSEVATQLAGRCGLTAVVDPTASMVGQYYQIEHSRLALSRFSRFSTAWDLLSDLAQIEQFNLWVDSSTLHFQSSASTGTVRHIDFRPPDQYHASPSLNVSSLVLERSLALAGGVAVSVSTWNSRQRKRLVTRSVNSPASADAVINVLRPNLLPDTAQRLADGICSQASGHQRRLSGTMPGDLAMSPRDQLRLVGVGDGWDGDYRVDSIDREITLAGGFVQHFAASLSSS